MELNKIQSSGSWGRAAESLNANFNHINSDMEKMKNASFRNKGYFLTEADMKAAYPTANVGDKAYVGTSESFAVWVYGTNGWKNSGKTGGDESVDLEQYYTKTEVDEIVLTPAKDAAAYAEVAATQATNAATSASESAQSAADAANSAEASKAASEASAKSALAAEEKSKEAAISAFNAKNSASLAVSTAEQAVEIAKDATNTSNDSLETSISNRYGYNVTIHGLKGGIHTIETAVKDVPAKHRMLGQKITFRTENGDWVTYHNESLSLDNYENVNDWLQEVGISSVQGDVNITNAPDYEDLTEVADGTIKFADKEYSKESFSGLGRVYLRKNILDGVNVLTQDMMSKPNTIYIIQYDYNLNGAEITIPEGCVLDFQGGSFSNGTIIGNNTFIEGRCLYFKGINISGTFNNLKPKFIADTDYKTFISCLNSINDKIIDFGGKTYSAEVSEESSFIINRNSFCVQNFNIKITDDSVNIFVLLRFTGSNITISDFGIDGNNKCVRALSFENSKNSIITNGRIVNVGNDDSTVVIGLEFKGGCSYCIVNNVYINNVKAYSNASGISIASENQLYPSNITISNSYIGNINSPTDADGIKVLEFVDFNNNILYHAEHCFENIVFENCDRRGLKLQCSKNKIHNIVCKNGAFSQACVDFFDDYPLLDGLYAYGLELTTSRNCVFLHNYKNANIKNIKANNNTVTFDKFNTLVYDENSYIDSSLIIENIDTDYNVLLRKSIRSEKSSLSINQVSIKTGYHYLIMGAYDIVQIENLFVDKSNLSNYWWRIFETNPRVLISNTYLFDMYPSISEDSNYTTRGYVTSNKTTLVTNVVNGKRFTYGKDVSAYPDNMYYQYYEAGDELDLPDARIRCVESPTSDNRAGKWEVIQFYTNNINNILRYKNNPSIYVLTQNFINYYSKYLEAIITKEGWYRIAELTDGSAGVITISKVWSSVQPTPSIVSYTHGLYSDIKLINGYSAYSDTITKVRINYIDSENKSYLEVYYSGTKGNKVMFGIFNNVIDTVVDEVIESFEEGEIKSELSLTDKELREAGKFEYKPIDPPLGYGYFCEDKQTTEGATNGIMIYHKGNNVWVDALGRVVE